MDERQHALEVLKARHDTLKHVTTLSGAGAVAMVAIYREGILPKPLLVISLVLFALSVVIGLFGIQWIVSDMEYLRERRAGEPFESPSSVRFYDWSITGFASGLVALVVALVTDYYSVPPTPVLIVAVGGAVLHWVVRFVRNA